MEKTSNYQLNQWEATDPLRREDFNRDNAAVDAALKAVADTAAGKAGAEELAAVSQSVAAVSAALGSKGNCRITTGNYTGDGAYGPDNPITLTFPFKPLWVMVAECGKTLNTTPTKMDTCVFLRPLQGATSTHGSALQVTWTEDSVSWYCSEEVTNAHMAMNNYNAYLYYWVALGTEE